MQSTLRSGRDFQLMMRISKGYEDAACGFSDEKLEQLCQHTLWSRGLTPWAAWESENSSFGKAFRKWACYPSFLPLFFSSDHGVHWESRCWPNEIHSPYKIFFTWNQKKSKKIKANFGKNSYYVPHPWIFYRKKYYPKKSSPSCGTLVFFAHSNATATPIYKDIDKYISNLKKLPKKYHPITICLSFHDVEKGLHKKLRSYGIPIVTAGVTSAKIFVDRFYSLIQQFRYATSPNIGSHTFYIVESGVPFFLFGDHPEYEIKGSDAVPDGVQDLRDYGDEEDIQRLNYLRAIFSRQHDVVTEEQMMMVSEYLGLNSNVSRFHAFLIIWGALIFNFPSMVKLYFEHARRAVSKLRVSCKNR